MRRRRTTTHDNGAGHRPDRREQEIFVTAQFREQRLQDTPLAITAIPAELLEARSQDSLVEVANQAPNVVLRQQGASFGPSIGASIRGIGQFDFSPAFEPGVGIYIDDVYYSALTGANFDLLDLERVEILRGPQGTLQGRNSVGGAIRLITRRPDADGGGFVEAAYGSRQLFAFRGGATFTITDGLYARIAGTVRQQEGFVDRIDYGCANPGSGIAVDARGRATALISQFGGVGYAAVRGALRYNPNPDVDHHALGRLHPRRPHHCRRGAGRRPQPPGNTLNIGRGLTDRIHLRPLLQLCRLRPAGRRLAGTVRAGNSAGRDLGRRQYRLRGLGHVASNADFNVSEAIQLTSITAYREWENRFNADDDLSPSNIGFGQNALDYWFWSQELRAEHRARRCASIYSRRLLSRPADGIFHLPGHSLRRDPAAVHLFPRA